MKLRDVELTGEYRTPQNGELYLGNNLTVEVSYGESIIERHILRERGTITAEAESLVLGDRQQSYGHPRPCYEQLAKIWSAYLGIEITASNCVAMLILMKLSREKTNPKRDNRVDVAGYALVMEMLGQELPKP